jgi:hypothetical protein
VSTAHAEPNGTPMAFTCDGEDVIINVAGQGRVGYIDGEKLMAVSITGTVDGETVFVKVFGGGKQLTDPDAITCVSPEDEDGFSLTVIAVPA